MWVAQKVICTFLPSQSRDKGLFSAKSLTSCELADTKYVRTEQQAPCQLPATQPSPATRRPFPERPQLLKPSDIFRILSSNFSFFQFFAKNSLAIRCSSSRNNENIQVCLCLPSVLYSPRGECSDTPAPSPGGGPPPSARHVPVCWWPLTLCQSAPLAGVFRHLSVSVPEQGSLVR